MTPPPLFRHQQELLDATWELPAWAVFFSTGCGKTAPTIHTAVRLFEQQRIHRVVVLAPNGVHRNWITDELPKHCSIPWRGLDWHSSRAKAQDRAFVALAAYQGLAWFAITYDAMKTPRGRQAILDFTKGKKFLLVADEGSRLKNPEAQQTKKAIALRRLASHARILNGTPVTSSPLEIYSQMKFLDELFWTRHGIASWTSFRSRFAVMKKIVVGGHDDREEDVSCTATTPHGATAAGVAAYEQLDLDQLLAAAVDESPEETRTIAGVVRPVTGTTGRTIDVVVGYRDLDKLHQMIQLLSTRLTKEQAGLDLPPKLYQRLVFELAPEQRRIYDELRTEYMVELAGGQLITAPLAIVRITRLQQVACGYLPNLDDPEGEPILIPGAKNPRLDQFLDWMHDIGNQQAIVWCRFTHDVDSICRALGPAKCVRYDGKVSEKQKAEALDLFKSGKRQICVAKASSMGMGLTLVNSAISFYYSNTFSVLERLQSEDRQHRPGQHNAVTYVDLIAENTVDERILKSLRDDYEIGLKVTGDEFRAWLE